MEIIGLICEYNPLHNGHIYHITKIKERYPNSILILVLNGYFTERGEISFLTKEDKTSLSLLYGIDIVLELPSIYGTQSADTFAEISLKMLNNFHVTRIIFGSESDNITTLTNIAKKQLNDNYQQEVKNYLDQGLNYPTALAKALDIDFDFNPNDLLGISYIKAIIRNNYSITPETIKRTNSYHDLSSNESIISAANIRKKITKKENITPYLPPEVIQKLTIPNKNLLFKILKSKILTDFHLEDYLDVDEGIEYRLKDKIINSKTYDEFITNIKTKRYTYNKINRMLIHILLGFQKKDNPKDFKLSYIKILGFNKNGQSYLNSIKDSLLIPINSNKETIQYQYELKASLIYDILTNNNTYIFEQNNKPIIKD